MDLNLACVLSRTLESSNGCHSSRLLLTPESACTVGPSLLCCTVTCFCVYCVPAPASSPGPAQTELEKFSPHQKYKPKALAERTSRVVHLSCGSALTHKLPGTPSPRCDSRASGHFLGCAFVTAFLFPWNASSFMTERLSSTRTTPVIHQMRELLGLFPGQGDHG